MSSQLMPHPSQWAAVRCQPHWDRWMAMPQAVMVLMLYAAWCITASIVRAEPWPSLQPEHSGLSQRDETAIQSGLTNFYQDAKPVHSGLLDLAEGLLDACNASGVMVQLVLDWSHELSSRPRCEQCCKPSTIRASTHCQDITRCTLS